MRTFVRTLLAVVVPLVCFALAGCHGDRQAAAKARLTKVIAAKLPAGAQLVAEAGSHSPMVFTAPVEGVVYYVANGEILLSTPLGAYDTIRLNDWTGIPDTQVTLGEEVVYHDPGVRWGDNRFYFVPDN